MHLAGTLHGRDSGGCGELRGHLLPQTHGHGRLAEGRQPGHSGRAGAGRGGPGVRKLLWLLGGVTGGTRAATQLSGPGEAVPPPFASKERLS